jgi:hypothetical protein
MTSKISVVAAIALAAIVAIPAASDAASQKHRGAPSNETGLTNPGTCLGGGCTSENPDRVVQPCNGSQCYKRSRARQKLSSQSLQ